MSQAQQSTRLDMKQNNCGLQSINHAVINISNMILVCRGDGWCYAGKSTSIVKTSTRRRISISTICGLGITYALIFESFVFDVYECSNSAQLLSAQVCTTQSLDPIKLFMYRILYQFLNENLHTWSKVFIDFMNDLT